MLNRLLNALFPQKCPVCSNMSPDRETAPICSECWDSISQYNGAVCLTCGKPLISDRSTTCADCIREKPAFKRASSFGLYDNVLRTAINLYKYQNVKRLSKPLSDIILRVKAPRIDTVIPVPLYKKRLRQRGFNQSALLAGHVAKGINACLAINTLVKIKDTAPQVGLNSVDRKKNIKNAFKILSNKLIKDKNVLVIDDVITTGATVRECSKELKRAGAKEVIVAALAYGIRD